MIRWVVLDGRVMRVVADDTHHIPVVTDFCVKFSQTAVVVVTQSHEWEGWSAMYFSVT